MEFCRNCYQILLKLPEISETEYTPSILGVFIFQFICSIRPSTGSPPLSLRAGPAEHRGLEHAALVPPRRRAVPSFWAWAPRPAARL